MRFLIIIGFCMCNLSFSYEIKNTLDYLLSKDDFKIDFPGMQRDYKIMSSVHVKDKHNYVNNTKLVPEQYLKDHTQDGELKNKKLYVGPVEYTECFGDVDTTNYDTLSIDIQKFKKELKKHEGVSFVTGFNPEEKEEDENFKYFSVKIKKNMYVYCGYKKEITCEPPSSWLLQTRCLLLFY